MTPEKINRAIAEWMGWKKEHRTSKIFVATYPGEKPMRYGMWTFKDDLNEDNDPGFGPPDYCNDLNAMHEAEKKLDRNQAYAFDKELKRIVGVSLTWSIAEYDWHSTAAQRAEALLRTIGRWEEE